MATSHPRVQVTVDPELKAVQDLVNSGVQGVATSVPGESMTKGLNEITVVLKHAMRNALTPIITIFGLDVGLLLGGAVGYFAFDVASHVAVAFPLLLVPQLGLVRTGAFFGLLNAAVAAWALWLFRGELRRLWTHVVACAGVVAALCAAMAYAERISESVSAQGMVWINGHRWLLVPSALREHGHRGPIGLLLDVPFPTRARLEALPWYGDLMTALCQLDLIGFRTPSRVKAYPGVKTTAQSPPKRMTEKLTALCS